MGKYIFKLPVWEGVIVETYKSEDYKSMTTIPNWLLTDLSDQIFN